MINRINSKKFFSALVGITGIVIAFLLSLALPSRAEDQQVGSAEAQQVECTNNSGGQFKAVALTELRYSTVDFSASGGQLNPTPLLETQIKTGTACILVHFSAQADPLDNHIVFQASIDDVPMEGHTQFPYLSPAPTTPVVFDPEETNLNASRMVAYTFFARVSPGIHTVRIKWAGCCGLGTPSALIRAATMSVHY